MGILLHSSLPPSLSFSVMSALSVNKLRRLKRWLRGEGAFAYGAWGPDAGFQHPHRKPSVVPHTPRTPALGLKAILGLLCAVTYYLPV